MAKALLIKKTDPVHDETLAKIMSEGGVVGAIWGHHLYFMACNAFDAKAVRRMNKIKNRSQNQVFASPGAIEEAEEFADLQKCRALTFAAGQMKMQPLSYLEFLLKKVPLGVELFANKKTPSSVTFATKDGKTIWIAGHVGDKSYSNFLAAVRALRRSGKKIMFAGTSLNLKGENTLTVKELDQAVADFGGKVDALSVYPDSHRLKKLRYSTSCSVVSFTGKRPRLLRIGCSTVSTLKKYIPGLEVPEKLATTRKK